MPLRKTFSKEQRLKSRKKLQQLFSAKNVIYVKNIKLLYLAETSGSVCIKCGVGTGGRFFKKAVDRNRIKRMLREAYRLQQPAQEIFANHTPMEISLFLLYIGKEIPGYGDLFKNVGIALQKFASQKLLQSAASQP